jgi:hypothetical protein
MADPITTAQPAEPIIEQITLSMYRQLDEAILERFEAVGRVRDDRSRPKNAGEGCCSCPLKRLGTVEDIGYAALFLASKEAWTS